MTSGPEQPVPIASLTKMMTAYVVLTDHPLGLDQNGPSVTMTQTDVDDFDNDTVDDESNAQVALGEVLTERQLLEGLLVHSANNFADTLARWDAGDIPTFVAKMNRTAAQLGMSQTHYADASGFDQGSQSTAGDLLKVAARDMANPTFAAIVKMPSVTLPVAGTISTYTPWLGFDGVIGVKSGFTTAAGGCDVVAVVRQVHGKNTLILAAVTGQTGYEVLQVAGYLALNLADHVGASIGVSPVVEAGQVVAHVNDGCDERDHAQLARGQRPSRADRRPEGPGRCPDRNAGRIGGRPARDAARGDSGAAAAATSQGHHDSTPILRPCAPEPPLRPRT
jgi:D-alanyl-D-alanine carboxypeptidase (penicillin-binding protein 5/6)